MVWQLLASLRILETTDVELKVAVREDLLEATVFLLQLTEPLDVGRLQ
jgi:hypothetical protein